MQQPSLPPGTLIVGRSSSSCNNCGQGVCHWEIVLKHDECCGYGEQPPGCGIQFTHVFSSYFGNAQQVVREGRPDLEFISIEGSA